MRIYSLNISMVFTRLPFLNRFDAAAASGFAAVEFWWPRQELLDGLAPDALVAHVRDVGIDVALMNLDGGDFAAGDRGLAGVPGREVAFRDGLPMAFELAERLNCRRLNALAGRRAPGCELGDQLRLLDEGLAFAADLAPRETMIAVEALNSTDVPGYLLPSSRSVLDTIDRVDRPNVGFQLDVYHLATEGEDPVAVIRKAAGRIAHVQFADVPGRHEPGTGALAFGDLVRALDEVGFGGVIGLEYAPSTPEAPDFSFVEDLATL
jgi:hydroxypyruvate isomerase